MTTPQIIIISILSLLTIISYFGIAISEKESIRVVEKEEKKLGFFGRIHKVLNDYALRILLFLVGFLILRRIIIRNFGNIL